MVTIYIKNNVDFKLASIANDRNKKLREAGKDATVTKSTIIQEIVYEWYARRKENDGLPSD